MNECAQLIERAMKYIMIEIQSYENNSVNAERLRSNMNMALIVNVKKLILYEKEEQIRKIEYLFKHELNSEIYRLRNDRNCKS